MNNKAFSLIEAMIYVFILALLAGAVFSSLVWIIDSKIKSRAMQEALDSASRAMEAMLFEIRNGKKIYEPTTSLHQLSLETENYLANEEQSSYIDFYLCEGRICFKKEGFSPLVLTSDAISITQLNFYQVSSNSIKIELTAQNLESSIELTSSASTRSYE